MNRKELKSHAKNLIKTGEPRPVYVSIVYVVILIVLAILSFKLVGQPMSEFIESQFGGISFSIEDSNPFDSYIDQQQFIKGLQESIRPGAQLLNVLLNLIGSVIGAGFIIFALRIIDGSGAAYGNLFDGFAMFFRIIWLYILQGIFIFLWALLLVIPGIIAFYRYRMAIYLLLEHPEMSAMDCINESKRLMKGHKGELFALDLSFLGWLILYAVLNFVSEEFGIALFGTIGLGYIVRVWLLPFTAISWALYYRKRIADSGFGETIDLDSDFA